MFKEFFIIFLLGHILGDFYVQTNKMAEKKEKSVTWVLIHCLYYWATMFFICMPIMSGKMALAATLAAIFHLIIDLAKFKYLLLITKGGKRTQTMERNVFIIDQILHFVCIVGVSYWLVTDNVTVNEWMVIRNFFSTVGVSQTVVLTWILALLMIHKPANIVIRKLLAVYKPEGKEGENKSNYNAGRFIGTIERIIMLIFLSIGQYSAIGLVLTAKSIARYDKIAHEPEFAEYYLLGTLLSTVIVVGISFVIL